MPRIRVMRIAGSLEMFGNQCSVLINRIRVTHLYRRGDAPVQFGAVRLELRLVGHGTNQRVMKRVLGYMAEPHLIDELSRYEIRDLGFDSERSQQVDVELRTDHGRSA